MFASALHSRSPVEVACDAALEDPDAPAALSTIARLVRTASLRGFAADDSFVEVSCGGSQGCVDLFESVAALNEKLTKTRRLSLAVSWAGQLAPEGRLAGSTADDEGNSLLTESVPLVACIQPLHEDALPAFTQETDDFEDVRQIMDRPFPLPSALDALSKGLLGQAHVAFSHVGQAHIPPLLFLIALVRKELLVDARGERLEVVAELSSQPDQNGYQQYRVSLLFSGGLRTKLEQ